MASIIAAISSFALSFGCASSGEAQNCFGSPLAGKASIKSTSIPFVAPVRKELRCELSEDQQRAMRDPDLRKRVNVKRSTIPAVTHVDMSARIQSVDEKRNGRYYRQF